MLKRNLEVETQLGDKLFSAKGKHRSNKGQNLLSEMAERDPCLDAAPVGPCGVGRGGL
jgi:hypothetical protein